MWLTSCSSAVFCVGKKLKSLKMFRRNFCTVKVLFITTLVLLMIFAGVLVLAFIGIPMLIDGAVDKAVELDNGTVQWDRFMEVPFGIDFKIYLFNVTNSDDILQGATPIIKEVGPYHYIERRHKDILELDSKEDSVTYEQRVNLTFDQDLSDNLTEEDEVTVLNVVLMSMSQVTNPVERMVLGGCLSKLFPPGYDKLFIKLKVRDLLINGFEFAVNYDYVGIACGIVRQKLLDKATNMRNIEIIYNPADDSINSLKFSFFNYKLARPDGNYTVKRGLKDVSTLGTIIRWNDDTHLPYWGRLESTNNDTCKLVRGTDSTIYAPFMNKSSSLDIFSTDICRIITIHYSHTDTYKGVNGYRFEINENTLRTVTENSENDCFCVKNTFDVNEQPSCFLDGVTDIMPCLGAPIILSFPHFLYADEKYGTGVEGLSPDENLHKIYLLVEPNTGTPLEGKKRVQFNVVLRPASFLDITKDLPRTVLPLLWVEEGVSLPQEYVEELNEKYFNKLKVAEGVKYGLIAVSAAAVLICVGFLIRKKMITGK